MANAGDINDHYRGAGDMALQSNPIVNRDNVSLKVPRTNNGLLDH